MAAYRSWGVDLAIDLEHQMLEVEPGTSPDPTARDARGSCKLELRNGELWAFGVTWTPDGAQRLQQKRQRYVSPAFDADTKTKRVLKMINVAITSIPATHHTPALVAARKNMATFDPAKTSPADAHKLVAQIARLLGVEPNHDAVEKGLQVLFSVITDQGGDSEDGSDMLTASERAACKSQGCSPRDLLRVKRMMNAI
jgi:phage I-like protein